MSADGDAVRWDHWSAGGHGWIVADLARATIAWNDGGEPRALAADDLAALRALAEAVRPEHALLQPSHITYASDEALDVVLGERRCHIDASDGVIGAGPPLALVDRLHATVRGLKADRA